MDIRQGKAQALLTEESTILERVARIISSVRGTRPDYAHLATELEPTLPFDLFGIVLLNHDRLAARVTVCEREETGWIAHYHRLPLAESMVARVLRTISPVDLCQAIPTAGENRADRDAFFHGSAAGTLLVENFPAGVNGLPAQCGDSLCGHPQLRAILVAPLIAGGTVLGTLELGSTRIGAYGDPALQRLIHAIASVLATAIEGAQAGGNVEIQNRQRDELKDVSTVLTSAVDLPTILERIVTGITNTLRVSSAIVRLDQSQRRLSLEVQRELDPVLFQNVLRRENILSDQTILGATLRQRAVQVSPDISHDERFPLSQSFASELHIKSLSCFPLIAGQYVYGVLLLLSPDVGGFTPLKTDIFTLFAGQATVAIQNGLLLQSAQERRRFQEVIEQFERASQEERYGEQAQANEWELLTSLRKATRDTFGVSLSGVLHFISDHLLTRSEREAQDNLRSVQTLSMLEMDGKLDVLVRREQGDEAALLARSFDAAQLEVSPGYQSTVCLTQAVNAALVRTDFLRESSAALMRVLHIDEAHPQTYEHLRRALAEPWFLVDLDGNCVAFNRAAEAFCEMHADLDGASAWCCWPPEGRSLLSFFRPLSSLQVATLTLERTLGALLPRARNLPDLLGYLREFTFAQSRAALPSEIDDPPPPVFLYCILAAEPLSGQLLPGADARAIGDTWSVAGSQEPHAVIAPPSRQCAGGPANAVNSPSDRHYHLTRHALYNEQGQWFANALHVHDVTEQVRDEKNKAVLLASVSHDLRTPLTSIKAAVTGLLQPDVVWGEELRREALQEIDAETDHLHKLVNAFVEMSRIEMGALTLDKEWCDIVELMHTVLSRTQRLLADFKVETRICQPLPLIHADYVQLGRVFTNLLENATRYSPRHTGICVGVDLVEAQDLPPDMQETAVGGVRVRVADAGPGIPEEERERVFKSFYSLHAQGNGLGLAICRGIIEAHQGRIWVEASEQAGACFVFVLPIALSVHSLQKGA